MSPRSPQTLSIYPGELGRSHQIEGFFTSHAGHFLLGVEDTTRFKGETFVCKTEEDRSFLEALKAIIADAARRYAHWHQPESPAIRLISVEAERMVLLIDRRANQNDIKRLVVAAIQRAGLVRS